MKRVNISGSGKDCCSCKEKWKDIKGFEGIYKISNYGRLKSYKDDKNGKILSNVNKKGDYFSVVLESGNKKKYTRIHRLVAEYFIGSKSKSDMQIHHIDGNKQNNCECNLEWITPKEHRKKTLKEHPQIVTGMVNYNQYIKPKIVEQFTLTGELLAEYPNAKEAEKTTGICSRNILQVASKDEYKPGKTRSQAGGYVWRFKEEP